MASFLSKKQAAFCYLLVVAAKALTRESVHERAISFLIHAANRAKSKWESRARIQSHNLVNLLLVTGINTSKIGRDNAIRPIVLLLSKNRDTLKWKSKWGFYKNYSIRDITSVYLSRFVLSSDRNVSLPVVHCELASRSLIFTDSDWNRLGILCMALNSLRDPNFNIDHRSSAWSRRSGDTKSTELSRGIQSNSSINDDDDGGDGHRNGNSKIIDSHTSRTDRTVEKKNDDGDGKTEEKATHGAAGVKDASTTTTSSLSGAGTGRRSESPDKKKKKKKSSVGEMEGSSEQPKQKRLSKEHKRRARLARFPSE